MNRACIISMLQAVLVLSVRGFLPAGGYQHQQLHSSTVCRLNRFLFSPHEIDQSTRTASLMSEGQNNCPTVTIPKDDYRTIHAAKILRLHNGDAVRAGIVGMGMDDSNDHDRHAGLLTDDATIEWIPEGKVKKAEPLRNGEPPGSLRIHLQSLQPPSAALSPLQVSLILALPRPIQLGRILPMIAQMGVDRLVLTGARKVPHDYFGSHLFRTPHELTARLMEGLGQAGDTRLPRVHVVRGLSQFLQHDLDQFFPGDQYARVVAHPQRPTSSSQSLGDQRQPPDGSLPTHPPATIRGQAKRMRQVVFPQPSNHLVLPPQQQQQQWSRRIVVAVGPEGGWDEPDELDLLLDCGFQHVTLGPRVLRSDCAVVSLLSLAHDVCCSDPVTKD